MTNYEMVREFHKAFNSTLDQWPPTQDTINLRLDLLYEESGELVEELIDRDLWGPRPLPELSKSKIAKEMADLLYVVYGAAASFGIDIDKVFKEVHRSNMSKLGEDGKPIYREDGKVLKGPNYSEAQIELF